VATKKQVRRRQKLRRHEYEEVYVDAEGNVVEEPEEEQEPESKPARNGKRAPAKRPTGRGTGRVVQPPSWRRVGKRALLFGPLLFLAFSILPGSDDTSPLQRVVLTLQYMVLLIPFMYLMDRLTYRMYLKRTGQAAGRTKRS
jgi:hypothetical protein